MNTFGTFLFWMAVIAAILFCGFTILESYGAKVGECSLDAMAYSGCTN